MQPALRDTIRPVFSILLSEVKKHHLVKHGKDRNFGKYIFSRVRHRRTRCYVEKRKDFSPTLENNRRLKIQVVFPFQKVFLYKTTNGDKKKKNPTLHNYLDQIIITFQN